MRALNQNIFFAAIMTWTIVFVLSCFGYESDTYVTILLFLASYPWKVGEDIFSLWGGFSEGNIFSIFSVLQVAKEDAGCLCGLGFQFAGYEATQFAGINIVQFSRGDTYQLIGFSLVQGANSRAEQGMGITCIQFSTRSKAENFVGCVIIQRAKMIAEQTFGVVGIQMADRCVKQCVGIAICQFATGCAKQYFGIVFVQGSTTEEPVQRFGLYLLQFKPKKECAPGPVI